LYFDNELTGTTIRNLSHQSLRNTPIPLPPTLPEQRAIATALSDVNGLLDGLDRLIAENRDLEQAAM
jgi:type I restriction enzyme S subunit